MLKILEASNKQEERKGVSPLKDKVPLDTIEEESHEKSLDLEMDSVNKHMCMKAIIQVIRDMNEMFGENWTSQHMPVWMQALHIEISKTECPLNVKIFILKILINNQDIFMPYARFWFKPIGNYITTKDNGGVGFHYFTRDLCSLLLAFHQSPKYPFKPDPESD